MNQQRINRVGNRHTSRGLACERLEDRRLLAGNVGALKSGSVLILTGDNLANEVGVFQSSPGVIGVFGQSTAINGVNAIATFSGISSITADLRGGDDRLGIAKTQAAIQGLVIGNASAADRLPLSGNIAIYAGEGNDQVGILAAVGGIVHVDLGNGNDQLGILASQVKFGIGVLGVNGNDSILVRGVSAASLVVNTGNGNDSVSVDDSSFTTNIVISTGNGNDNLSIGTLLEDMETDEGENSISQNGIYSYDTFAINMTVDLGADTDSASLDGVKLTGSLAIAGGLGTDQIAIAHSSIRYHAAINAGPGANRVSIDGVNIGGNLTILGGELVDEVQVLNSTVGSLFSLQTIGGNDRVRLQNVNVKDLIFADLGAGNDELEISGIITKKAVWFGSLGTDKLTNGGGNSISKTDRKQFEIVV